MLSNSESRPSSESRPVRTRPYQVAIVGRPNVGKSTLFNIMTGTRNAVVKNESGVTRDIQVGESEVWGKKFEIIDTGGLTEAADTFSQLIREQVLELLKSVDVLLVVMDGLVGVIPEDRELMKIVSESGCSHIIVANKIDRIADEGLAVSDFYEFGSDVVAAAFETRRGLSDIMEWLDGQVEDVHIIKKQGPTISLVGKPNVGKSSLVNHLLGDLRMLVCDIAGTTVDAVDSQIMYDDKKYVLVDTAGLRRAAKRKEGVEILSTFKSRDAISRSNLVWLLVDGCQGPSDQDARIVQEVLEQHKGVILVVNKSDLGEEQIPAYRKTFREKLSDEFHFYADIPVVFISAKTGAGIKKLFETVNIVHKKLNFRIPTRELNDFFFQAIRQAPAPIYGTKTVKFYYLTQTHQVPPSFIAFANHPDGVDKAYRRFLAKRIRKRWGLEGVPIRIFVMRNKK